MNIKLSKNLILIKNVRERKLSRNKTVIFSCNKYQSITLFVT